MLLTAGRRLALIVLLLTACQGPAEGAGSATSASSGSARSGGTFTEAVAGSAGFLNPLFADEDNARDINGLIYQGLTRIGADQQPEPLLASRIELSPNHLTYRVHLRTDVKWADGLALTADDVMFTFHVLQDPAYTLPGGAVWKGVEVKKVAADEVDLTLKAPSAGFLNSLRVGILPQHLFPGDVGSIPTSPYSGAKAIGTGPFMVESISPDRSVVALRRNSFASPAPHLDRVVFRGYSTLDAAIAAVAAGEADAVGGLPSPAESAILARAPLAIHDARTFSFAAVFLDLDPSRSYLSNPAVRRALSQAIDRRRLIREVLQGNADPQNTPLPPSMWAFSGAAAARYPYDPAAAEKALDDAGWTVPAQGLNRSQRGRDFIVDLVAADGYPYREIALALERQLATIGVGVHLNVVPPSQLVTRYLGGRAFQMALANLDNGPDPDQFAFWHSSESAYPLNFSRLPGQGLIDKALEDGRVAVEMPARAAAYGELQDLLAEAAPAIFLYEPHYEYFVNRRIGGIHLNKAIDPVDRFQYVTDWYASGG